MVEDSYESWTEIKPGNHKQIYYESDISNPLLHLKQNYLNVKSPIAFSGLTNIYNFYGGKLTYREIKDFLKSIDSYTLHKKSRVLQYNPSFSRYRRQQLQIDLVDIQQLSKSNEGYRFLFTAIDSFTRFGFCQPLKDKKSLTVLNGFKSILQKAKDYPDTLMSDSGSEFVNKKFLEFCKENSITCYQSYTSTHAAYVERFNRSIKNKIYAYMDGNNTKKFIDVLPDIINSYNYSVHRMIGMPPIQAEKKGNHSKIRVKMEKYYRKFKKRKPQYNVGQSVRITNFPSKFQRGYEIQNKNEVFIVHSVNKRLPLPLYKLHTYGDPEDIIKGSFYEYELTPTELDKFYIEKIIKKNKNKVLVKWEGYSLPTWEPRDYIENLLKQQ